MENEFDPDLAKPIPNPTTETEIAFNKSLSDYLAAKAEQKAMESLREKLASFSQEMKDPEKQRQFIGGLHQLARGHVSEVERREHAWLTKKIAEARTIEQADKAKAKMSNWRKSHPAASVILERRTQ